MFKQSLKTLQRWSKRRTAELPYNISPNYRNNTIWNYVIRDPRVWMNCETPPELWVSNQEHLEKRTVHSMRDALNRNKERYDNRNSRNKWKPCYPGQLIEIYNHRRPDAPGAEARKFWLTFFWSMDTKIRAAAILSRPHSKQGRRVYTAEKA